MDMADVIDAKDMLNRVKIYVISKVYRCAIPHCIYKEQKVYGL